MPEQDAPQIEAGTGRLVYDKERRTIVSTGKWQPIETAPKDGTKIDLWITNPKGALTVGDYGRVADCWFSAGKWWLYDETKYATDSANCRSEVWNVTHWMPRPVPPPT